MLDAPIHPLARKLFGVRVFCEYEIVRFVERLISVLLSSIAFLKTSLTRIASHLLQAWVGFIMATDSQGQQSKIKKHVRQCCTLPVEFTATKN